MGHISRGGAFTRKPGTLVVNLDQVDVRVKKVNKTERYRMKLAIAGRDETRCPVIKPLNNSILNGSSRAPIRGEPSTDKSGRRKKGELKRTWVASLL